MYKPITQIKYVNKQLVNCTGQSFKGPFQIINSWGFSHQEPYEFIIYHNIFNVKSEPLQNNNNNNDNNSVKNDNNMSFSIEIYRKFTPEITTIEINIYDVTLDLDYLLECGYTGQHITTKNCRFEARNDHLEIGDDFSYINTTSRDFTFHLLHDIEVFYSR